MSFIHNVNTPLLANNDEDVYDRLYSTANMDKLFAGLAAEADDYTDEDTDD